MTPADESAILSLCERAGFALAGVCSAHPTDYADELAAWIAAGKHGEMSYLADQLAARLDPNLVLEGARSAVIVADMYHTRDEPSEAAIAGAGRIARYARGRDYHASIKKRLHALADELRERFPGEEFRAFTDTAPVMERELAARAGVGWTGKHTLTINPKLGSWFFLGGLLTTLERPGDHEARAMPDHCGTCTRCIDACPTNAITPYSVDATRCISYLTIEHRSPINPAFFESIGGWIAGCDVCQEVCPHNSPRADRAVGQRHPDYEPALSALDPLEVNGWTAEDRASALKGSALKRIKLDMFRRNAVIVAMNAYTATGDGRLLKAIEAAAEDESELVRRTATDVLDLLGRPPASPG